jgi:hypothetical protein
LESTSPATGHHWRRLAAAAAASALCASIVYAQQIWVGGGFGGSSRVAPRWAQASDFDGSFIYCRGFFTSRWREQSGSGWNTDYPGADNNFSIRLAELTRVRVRLRPDRQPVHVVVALTDPLLFRCGMLLMEDIGTVEFSPEEVQQLRAFFLKGGFLWVDDSWGSTAWSSWVEQISRVLPPGEFPLFDIPPTHPIMRSLYNVSEIPQVPSISHWRRSGGGTSERGPDSAEVYVKGIQDSHGRLMVLATHNTDIADTWEREGEWPREYFDLFSPRGYAIGVNVVLYAMTH